MIARTVAVLPVKSFSRAKTRLGDVDRETLARAMVADVLAALHRVEALAGVVVVTSEPGVTAPGAIIVPDPQEAGHVHAALLGVRCAVQRGADRVLLVPGDCPALEPAEICALLAGGAAGSVTIVPDRHGSGTNALLLAPPRAMSPSFGPGSFARHAALGRAAGLAVRVASPPSLTHDVDTAEDLARLVAFAAARGSAPRTRAVAAGLALAA